MTDSKKDPTDRFLNAARISVQAIGLLNPFAWHPVVLAVVAFVLGSAVLARRLFTPDLRAPLIDQVIDEFGIAVVIFGLLALTFERFSHRQLDRAVKSSFDRLAGAFVGSKILPTFNKFYLNSKFSRRDMHIEVELIDHDDDPDCLVLRFMATSIVKNETKELAKYELVVWRDAPNVQSKAMLNPPRLWWNHHEQSTLETVDTDAWTLKRSIEVELPGLQEGHSRTAWDFAVRPIDTYSLTMSYFCEDVHITFRHPPRYEVTVILRGPMNDSLLRTLADQERSEWEMASACMPGYAFDIKWRLKGTAGASNGTVPTNELSTAKTLV